MTALKTFQLPDRVMGDAQDKILGTQLVTAWRQEGIFQVQLTAEQEQVAKSAIACSKQFFAKPLPEKLPLVSDLTYSGYVACREEQTAGKADYSEIFTVCKDVPLSDPRVQAGWPCHGPVPWPDEAYKVSMGAFMHAAGDIGHILLQLVALGLGLEADALTSLAEDGWHHMRVLRFQKADPDSERGIGAHTDYGFLVIAVQSDAPGLDIRPPVDRHGLREPRQRNWLPEQSTAGIYEEDEHWVRVPLEPGVVTVFPGDLLQYVTGDYLVSTPHKVVLHPNVERFAIAYFHEPNFRKEFRPLLGQSEPDSIFYGKHFTQMFMRCYPKRTATERILRERRDLILTRIRQ